MGCRNRNVAASLALILLTLGTFLVLPVARASSRASTEQKATSTRKSARTEAASAKQTAKHQESEGPAGTSLASSDAQAPARKDLAVSLLENVLAGINRVTPIEYKILAQVEAATLLWQIDKERALTTLRTAAEDLRELCGKDVDESLNSKQRRLRFLAFRRIARLSPDLLKDFALNERVGGESGKTMPAEWTDEARAVLSIAYEQVDKDPALAARIAELGFSLGQVDWAIFLRKLSSRDAQLAEQVARAVIDRLRDSPITPIYLMNFYRFAMGQDRSPELKEYFLRSLTVRLKQAIRPGTPTSELSDHLVTAQFALRLAGGYERWEEELQTIVLTIEEILRAASAPAPESPKTITISMPPDIAPGDTGDVAEGARRVENVIGSGIRDQSYRELAAKAALKGDLRLAEDILSKIDSEGTRRDANLAVYGPFVRKATSDSDWPRAREYASRILLPLGRTLALDKVAQTVPRSYHDKEFVRETYRAASRQLQREAPSEEVAKAYLVLAKSLSSIDAERGLGALSWAVYVLNKVSRNGDLTRDFRVQGELALWVRVPGPFMSHEEVIDLSELIGSVFTDLAKRDFESAQSLALDLVHQGLYSFAELGVVRGLLGNPQTSPSLPAHNRRLGRGARIK